MESMMSAREVAELLGVHENWVYDQAVAGNLPSYKIGGARRFDPAEVRGWIAEHRQPDNGCRSSRRSARRPVAIATTVADLQHEERSSRPKTRHVNRKREEKARTHDDRQPRLFEGFKAEVET